MPPNQSDGPPPHFFSRLRAHQLGIGEDLHGAKPLPADGLRPDGMAVAEVEHAGRLFHPAEAVVHKGLGRPEGAVDAVVLHLGDLPQEAPVFLQAPGNRPVRQVIDQAPAANAQVGLQDQIQIGQAGPPAPVGIDVPVQQISHPQSLAQIVGGPQHRHRAASTHQEGRDRAAHTPEKQPLVAHIGPAFSGGLGQHRIAWGTPDQKHRPGLFPGSRSHVGRHLEQLLQHGGQLRSRQALQLACLATYHNGYPRPALHERTRRQRRQQRCKTEQVNPRWFPHDGSFEVSQEGDTIL